MSEAKSTAEFLRNTSIPVAHELNNIECAVNWETEGNVHTPKFNLGGYELKINITIETADPEDFEGYEEMYGYELEEGVYYYCDGECYFPEMNPHREGDEFSEFIAAEVNERISELNRA